MRELQGADRPSRAKKAIEKEIQRDQRIAAAKRRIRLAAAQIGDDKLWELVNTPPKRGGELIFKAHGPGGYVPGEPGDRYDDWNAVIREIFRELNK
jgi:hypothetical protein